MRRIIILIMVIYISIVSQSFGDKTDTFNYTEIMDTLSWQFRSDHESTLYSVQNFNDDYQIEIIRNIDNVFNELTIKLVKNNQEVYSWKGHDYSPFVEFKDILYYADYNPIRTGCTVVAYDLQERKQLWKTELKGLGPVRHSKYWNKAQITFWEGYLVVYGKEAGGKYLEIINIETGHTIGNKKLDE